MNNYNKVTWEHYTKDFGKWVIVPQETPSNPYPDPAHLTEEAMIEDILKRTKDKGFFEDIVTWLRRDAPKKLRPALQELHSIKQKPILYEWMCELVYLMNFRASERLEQRMILGPSNEWVKKYFGDFPPRDKE